MTRTRLVANAEGFTIIEVIVAIAIFSVGLLAMGALQTTAMMKTGDVTRKTEAWALLTEQAERLKQLPFYVDFPPATFHGDLTDGPHNRVSPDGRYTFQWQVDDSQPIPDQNQTALPGNGVPAGTYVVSKLITLSAFRTGANPLAPPLARVQFPKVVWAGTFLP
jgi:prepilin-type N-terminal cleavage/methylation domain-containing protein